MKKEVFLKKITEAIEIEEEINNDTVLNDLDEWDSLAAVTTLALFKKYLDLNITAENLKNCKTIGDILSLGVYE